MHWWTVMDFSLADCSEIMAVSALSLAGYSKFMRWPGFVARRRQTVHDRTAVSGQVTIILRFLTSVAMHMWEKF
jgi:hypothetical protein